MMGVRITQIMQVQSVLHSVSSNIVYTIIGISLFSWVNDLQTIFSSLIDNNICKYSMTITIDYPENINGPINLNRIAISTFNNCFQNFYLALKKDFGLSL